VRLEQLEVAPEATHFYHSQNCEIAAARRNIAGLSEWSNRSNVQLWSAEEQEVLTFSVVGHDMHKNLGNSTTFDVNAL
jgi:hypothetical protein